MQSVLDKIASRQSQRRQSAAGEYRELIHRYEKPRDGDEDRLSELLGELGITIEQARDDADAVAELRRWQADLAADADIAKANQAVAVAQSAAEEQLKKCVVEMIGFFSVPFVESLFASWLYGTGLPLDQTRKWESTIASALAPRDAANRKLSRLTDDTHRAQQRIETLRRSNPRVCAE